MAKTITAIITLHEKEEHCNNVITYINNQLRKPDNIIILYSNIDNTIINNLSCTLDIDILPHIMAVPDKKDWGHEKRAIGLALCETDYLVFMNGDDMYEPTFIQKMMEKAEETNATLIYGDFTSHVYSNQVVKSVPASAKITSGSYIVKTEVAKKAGYTNRDYPADWAFIRDVLAVDNHTEKIQGVYYHHR